MDVMNKIENNVITEKTPIRLPLGLWITIIIAVISLTASAVYGLFELKANDKEQKQEIEKKLDKTIYYSDRQRDSLTITRKLDLIMKHFNIEDYGQELK